MKDNIKKFRIQRNLTQKDIAEALGYETPSIVAMWEAGTRKVPSDKIVLLAKVLGCGIAELFA